MNPENGLDAIIYIASKLLWVFQLAIWGFFFYYLGISFFGWIRRKETPASEFPVKHKFAIIISAHNEETVVGGAVRSLKGVNYPESMYDIFVIADNCEDNTAEVARENGARVYERFDPVKRGKGHSLEWMFKKLFEMDRKYDAICILDADNLVSSNFFMEMNKQLCLGHKVIQGYLDSKNPSDSWVSGSYSISYWISNRLFQLPRHYLGLSCALGGTGFVMAYDVLRELGWGATCLTEDLEFSLKLVLKGMRVAWCHDAVVYDEKPLHMKQSWKQRKRWMQGHSDCAARFIKPLMKKAVKDRDMVAFDCGLYLLQPLFMVANGIWMLFGLIQLLFFSRLEALLTIKSLLVMLLIIALTYYTVIFVFIEGKLTRKIARFFIAFPLYGLTWVPIIISGFIARNRREWVHTLHTRALDINDIETLEKVG